MSANGPNDDWPSAVIAFLKDSLPVASRSPLTWSDDSMTAFQNGCDALVALGQAERIGSGALAKDCPKLPEILPHWDDLCLTVLGLANVKLLRAGRTPPGISTGSDSHRCEYRCLQDSGCGTG
jgi:pellino protein